MYQLEQFYDNDFEEIYTIMEQSFPKDERRSKEGQRSVLKEPYYQLYGGRKEGKTAAFFAVWQFESFSFIEHFAVEKNSRNGGIGAELLAQLLQETRKPVVLEVEPPEEELKRRRIAFYERNGFHLNEYDYVQPAMSAERKAIPLMMMSYPKELTEDEFEKIRDILYQHVYHVC